MVLRRYAGKEQIRRTAPRTRKLFITKVACMAAFNIQEVSSGIQTLLYITDSMGYLIPKGGPFFSGDGRRWCCHIPAQSCWQLSSYM